LIPAGTSDAGVVIVSYGRASALPSLIAQVASEGIPEESMIVVRNHGGDPTVEPPRLPPGVLTVNLADNLGSGRAKNVGIHHHLRSGRGWILLLSQDTEPNPGALATLLSAAQTAADYGVLGPVVGWARTGKVFSYGGVSRANGDIDHVRQDVPPPTDSGIARCDWIDGSIMLVRSDVFDQVGLFDERLFMYFGDTEFCLRARGAGWGVGVVLGARIEETPGLDRRPGAYAYLHARNGLEYARLAAGARGVGAALRRHARELRAALRRLATPGTTNRAEEWMRLRCEWRGVLHFLLRRWGPPPPNLPGRGDVR
jgi:GT2 family glycosyltransferase